MGSRLREKPEHIFEVFAEVGRPAESDGVAFVLQNYPESVSDKKILEAEIPKFAFPAETDSGAVEHFSFVLTDEEGKFKFGFCRHAAGSQTCLCIVSFLPWFEVFYRLLNLLAEILNRTESNSITKLLEALYSHPVPSANDKVEIISTENNQVFTFTCPDSSQLPCIPHNRNLTEYYNAVDVNTMMSIYASMLQERRILIVSRKLSRLTSCVHGSAALLYPLIWQHIYIPVLPPHLMDYCTAPMPFLIGIHSTLYKKLRRSELGDVVTVDADKNTIESDYDDLSLLPSEVVSLLKKRLKAQNAERIGSSVLGDGVAKAFLRANVAIIGGYRQALRFPPGEQITFDEDAFVHSRPSSMQPFLQTVLHTQMFEQFINERLDKLIAGEGFSDVFDEEVNLEHDKWATQSRYREWYSNMKKQGKKMKDRGKKAVKDIRTRFTELGKDDSSKAGISRNRPATISSSNLKSQRPPRPPPPDHSSILGYIPASAELRRKPSLERTRQYKVISMDELDDSALMPHTRPRSPSSPRSHPLVPLSPAHSLKRQSRQSRHLRRLPNEDTDILSDMTYQRVSLDLLGDQDIQSMLKKSYSLEDLTVPVDEDEWEEESSEDTDSGNDQEAVSYKSLDDSCRDDDSSSNKENNGHINNDGLSRTHPLVKIDETESVNNNNRETEKMSIDSDISGMPVTETPDENNQALFTTNTTAGQSSHSKVQEASDKSVTVTGLSSVLPDMGFEDNFNTSAPPPPLPPKIPLKRGHTIDSSTIYSSAQGLRSDVSVSSIAESGSPLARPRASVARQPAFYKHQRPPSFRKSAASLQQATDAQTIKEARTAFMKSDTTKSVMKKLNDLDQFDPLITGQLAVDTRRSDPEEKGGDEENLLKEWNLDFDTKLKGTYHAPPLPPKPAHLQTLRPYASTPSGLNSVGAYWSGGSSQHQGAVYQQRPLNLNANVSLPFARGHHQSVQQLIRHFTPGGNTQTLGGGPGRILRNKTDVRLTVERPASMYVESLQDPFSDLLMMNASASPPSRPAVRSALPPNVYTNGDINQSSTAVTVSGLGQSVTLQTTIKPGPLIEHPDAPLSHSTPHKKLQSWETFD